MSPVETGDNFIFKISNYCHKKSKKTTKYTLFKCVF